MLIRFDPEKIRAELNQARKIGYERGPIMSLISNQSWLQQQVELIELIEKGAYDWTQMLKMGVPADADKAEYESLLAAWKALAEDCDAERTRLIELDAEEFENPKHINPVSTAVLSDFANKLTADSLLRPKKS